jgi:O-antigen ligase
MTSLGLLPTRVIQLLVLLASGTVLLVRSGMQSSLALLLCICLIGLATHRRRLPAVSQEERLLAFLLLAYPTAVLLSFVWHQRADGSEFDAPSRFMLVIPLLLYLARVDVPLHHVYRWGCALGSISAAGWAVWSVGYGLGPFTDRAHNNFVNPVPFACITLILAFSALPDRSQSRRSHLLLWGCALAGFGAAIASQSRAVLLVIPPASLLYSLSYRARGTTSARQWLWIGVGTLALSGLSAGLLKERIEVGVHEVAAKSGELINSSMGIRLQLWHASGQVFLAHPLLGIGKGELPQELKHMAENGTLTPEAASFRHSHSDLLFLLAETGVVGALSVMVVYLAFGVAFVRRFSSPEPGVRSAAYAGTVTLGAYFAFGLADSMLTQTMQTAFLALAMTLLFAHIRQQERRADMAHTRVSAVAP